MTVLKISKLQEFVWKTMQAWLGGKISYNKCFQLSAAVAIATFEIYRWKFLGYLFWPIFNMLFPFVLTKFFKSELFSRLPKVNHVIKSCKEPISTGIPDFTPFSLQVCNIILYFLLKFLIFSSFFQELPCKSDHQKQWNNLISLIYHRRFVNRC